MANSQFHVLYREFLFRMVDREVLSAHAEGDSNRLLGRFAAVLVWISIGFAGMAVGVGNSKLPREETLAAAWGPEHALIATTMLITGLFAVLSWDTTFPSREEVLVLAPLPVRGRAILMAKAAALVSALSVAVFAFNALPGIAFPLALVPTGSSLLDIVFSPQLYRAFAAYWVTMAMAGLFVLCSILCVQGIAAQLPRSLFLRISSVLQIVTFCVCIGVYFLQPWPSLTQLANRQMLAWLPSYWFLGLFQQLNGSQHEALGWLATRAWAGCAIVVLGAALAFLFSSLRLLSKTAEEPDIAPRSQGTMWLPRVGRGVETAVVHFSVRTLLRSRPHRVILSFYSGLGFGIVILFLKTPIALRLTAASGGEQLHQVSLPLIASSFVMMCFWIVGVRVAFAMPVELRANWIFRITPILSSLPASRRAVYVLGVAPFWGVSAVVLLSLWPWVGAAGHLAVLAATAITAAELCLYGFRKLPFTCSWLPGLTNVHMTVVLSLIFGLNVTLWAARFELRALADAEMYSWLMAGLITIAAAAWWRTQADANSEEGPIDFEAAPDPAVLSLGLHRDGVLPIESRSLP